MNRFDLTGKAAIVTGGRRGIGKAFTRALLESGAEVAVIAQSPHDYALKEEMLNITGKKLMYVQADLADREKCAGVVRQAADHFGKVDILINNAGVQYFHAVDVYPLDKWDETIAVMLTAPLILSQDARKFGATRIINVASINSYVGARNITAYVVVKHGIVGMTKCMSNEWAPYGVTVNCIAPGFIATDMLERLDQDKVHKEQVINRIPAGRFGTPDDVVGAMLFLASDAGRYVTGQTILVDGGWIAR